VARVINGLMWLIGCQLVGEVIRHVTDAQVPGPVFGMVVLFIALRVRRVGDGANVVRAADALLRHLQLFFIPAGVGVVTYLAVIRQDALPIVAALMVSWVAGLATVGLVTLLFERARRWAG